MSEITNEQIEQHFAEIHPLLTQPEAILEANRCLYCYDAPCTHACPTHIDVPAFIKKIASGNLIGSARTIFDANPIGSSCAKVCPVEVLCEGACVEKTLVKQPIQIGRLQRYATEHVLQSGRKLFTKGEPNGKSIGIIGSGPAGLSCATYLARLGYAVTVYEKRELAGGLDTYGMAEYKMTQAHSLAEVKQVEDLGVEFKLNSAISHLEELTTKHDSVFLAVGLGKTKELKIANEDANGVIDALHFIEKVKTRDWKSVEPGKIAVVIGAGNTAIDAVTQAKRLGAEKAILVYRRTEKDAPAYDYEIELAKSDAIEFVWQAIPTEVLTDENGSVRGLLCRKNDGSDQQFEISCNLIIKAIGQQKQAGLLQQLGLNLDEKGRVVVNEKMQTSNPKVFAGGDCVNGGAEAVDAAQMGKLAAIGIHESLFGEKISLAGIK
jgi:dihydropyrimidine dehydrogenase (NAD+) subunit PreT